MGLRALQMSQVCKAFLERDVRGCFRLDAPPVCEKSGGFEHVSSVWGAASLVVVLSLLCVSASAEEEVSGRFDAAMVAMRASQSLTGVERDRMIARAISGFLSILDHYPDLHRVRLELARAQFLLGEDRKAYRNFERVLASGELPLHVSQDVVGFLYAIRQRRLWDIYLDLAFVHDSNINADSSTSTVWLHTPFGLLPFERMPGTGPMESSGTTLSITAETGRRFSDDLNLRTRLFAAFEDYAGNRFDRYLAGIWFGPQQSVGGRTILTLLTVASREWVDGSAQADRFGLKLEAAYRFTHRLTFSFSAYREKRDCLDCNWFDGIQREESAEVSWKALPSVTVSAGAGWIRERPRSFDWHTSGPTLRAGASVDTPNGVTVSLDSSLVWENYSGTGIVHRTPDLEPRRDRTIAVSLALLDRSRTFFGLSPRLSVRWDRRTTNAQAFDYRRLRVGLQLRKAF